MSLRVTWLTAACLGASWLCDGLLAAAGGPAPVRPAADFAPPTADAAAPGAKPAAEEVTAAAPAAIPADACTASA